MCIDTQTGETEFRERDSTSNDEPLLHYFLPSSYSFHSRRREIKRNPPHSIPPPLIGTTLLYAFVVISESISKKRREKKTQTFNQMSSSGSNVHSLTASKAKREKKKKTCLCDRPSNLNRPANDNCRDTLLTTDMGTKEPITQHLVRPMFRERNPVRVG